ncbi:MAG TPA: hypothetical protein VK458_16190, partial [Myxococcaceae bacterium]|nr:hypothetical protein [Myxococcaceae bacterium]
MTRVMEHLKEQQEAFAISPFVTFLRDSSLSPQTRLRFLPCVAPLVMGATELGRSLRGEPVPEQGVSSGESVHWGPFLKDLQAMDLHAVANFSSITELLWGEDCGPVREAFYDVDSLATDPNPLTRQVLQLALESVGSVSMAALEQVAREFHASTGKRLACIHSLSAHIAAQRHGADAVELDLRPDVEADVLAIIDEVFSLATKVADHLLDYVMRCFEGQEKPSRPHSLTEWIASQTFKEFGNSRIEALCTSAGFSAADTQKVQQYFTFMTSSWNMRRVGDASPW